MDVETQYSQFITPCLNDGQIQEWNYLGVGAHNFLRYLIVGEININ
jgi:hypothetical protein